VLTTSVVWRQSATGGGPTSYRIRDILVFMDCLAIRRVLVLVLNRMSWSHSGLVGLLFVLIDVVTAFCSFSHTQILNSYTYFKDVYYVDNIQMFIKHVWLQALTRIHFLSDAFRKPEFFFVTAVVWTRIMLASYFNFCWAYMSQSGLLRPRNSRMTYELFGIFCFFLNN